MRDILLISTGAVLGANLRYVLTLLFASRLGLGFPYGTLFVNVTGCFAAGLALTLFFERWGGDPSLRLLVATGFLGAYTTFSAFSYDTVALLGRGEVLAGAVNALASLLGCLVATYLGVLLARTLLGG